MSPRIAWIVLASLALPSLSFAQAEEEVVAAIRARLDANRRSDMAAWATEIGGQTTSVHKWQIETHVRRNGRWLLLGVADGLILPEPKSAKIEPSLLDAYVGEYEWAPTLLSKIERKGDRLLERLGPGEPAEWLPESDTTFFVPGAAAGGDASRIIFAKDAGGRVTHYVYRDLGATDRIVRKIK